MTGRSNRITEGSCWTCRKRRVRCDLVRPRCSRCETSDTPCEYVQIKLQWVGGAAVRGRLAPGAQASSDQPFRAGFALPPSPSSPPPDSETLVLYFSGAVLPRLQVSGRRIDVDENALLTNSTLWPAILAVSKTHHHQRSRALISSSHVRAEEQARRIALANFRHSLEASVDHSKTSVDLFQVVVLFCLLDGVISPNEKDNAPIQHLNGGFSMLKHWSPIASKMLAEGGLAVHLLSVFVTMDLIHALLSGANPHFEPSIWLMFADVHAWWGLLPGRNRFLILLKLFSEMALTAHTICTNPHGIYLAEKCLPSFQATLDAAPEPGTYPDFTSAEDWDAFCSLYEICATIYMLRVLQNRAVVDEKVQAATRKGVSILVDQRLPGMLAHCEIFPILVIGSHCIYSQDCRAVKESLSPSTSYLSFGNLLIMNNLLDRIWARHDMTSTWQDMFGDVSSKAFLF